MFKNSSTPSHAFIRESLAWLDSGEVVERLGTIDSFDSDQRLYRLMNEINGMSRLERAELGSTLTELQRRNLSIFAWRIQSGVAKPDADRRAAAVALDLVTYQSRSKQEYMHASAIRNLQTLPANVRSELEWLRMEHLQQMQISDPHVRQQQYDNLMSMHGSRILRFMKLIENMPNEERSVVTSILRLYHSSGMLRGLYLELSDAAVASMRSDLFLEAVLTFVISLRSASDRRDVLVDVPVMRDAGLRLGIDFDANCEAFESQLF